MFQFSVSFVNKGALSHDALFLLDETVQDKGRTIEENEIWGNKKIKVYI